jgi:hypothetical protein
VRAVLTRGKRKEGQPQEGKEEGNFHGGVAILYERDEKVAN